ncbi:MAG: hypothetical protein JXR96_02110 [Deltaproteobacteria bacterium]|nr:hypothetical protein [Deltaproteobacteria bacterium]
MKRIGLGYLALAMLAACGADGGGDGRDDAIAPAGKADFLYGECEVRQVLAYVNDLQVDEARLKADGVHSRAAGHIIAYRDGPDGKPGTVDDEYFDDIQELDDVYYVGPKAMEQLVRASAHRCWHVPQIEVVFSPQDYDSSHLARVAELIASAVRSVDIAMYSFRDARIMTALEHAVDRGVKVRFVFETANADRSDPDGSYSAKLEDAGVDVRYINKIMHHKFAIIDGPVDSLDHAYSGSLVTGSANWSSSAATRYDENTIIVRECGELLLRFQMEFNHLWENSRDFVWSTALEQVHSIPIHTGMIVDDPYLDAVYTSANFDTYVSSRYGPTFSVVKGRNAVSDRLVGLIRGASRSIHIASGHLRSHPVFEALLAKRAEDPGLDIRIYLDNQEYISEWYASQQDQELAECIFSAAGNADSEQACYETGLYFSYAAHEAGIPLRFKTYCYRWHYSYAEQMHHKYLVIDGQVLAAGSYNLSDNAEHNTIENMVIYDAARYPDLVAAFEDNFERLWVTGEAEGLYQALMTEITQGTGSSFPIVFAPMALSHDQVTALKDAIRDHCPEINSTDFRAYPERHWTCER